MRVGLRTRSGNDVILARGDEQAVVPLIAIMPVDTAGAGDRFRAGVLYGLATGRRLATCGRMACLAASGVISHFGARSTTDYMAAFRLHRLICQPHSPAPPAV
jgi:sugar/nucleoside kinase (ribokinase family)